MKYYRIHDKNSDRPARWFLASPIAANGGEIDARIFTAGRAVKDPGPLILPVRRQGPPQEFTLADFELPVLADTFAQELEQIAKSDIQRFSVSIKGSSEKYSIINIVSVVPCLDEGRSDVTFWPPDSGAPDMEGKYLTVSNIHVDPSKIENQRIFRLQGWHSAIIVAEPVGALLGDATGVVLERV
jgi:hypothetical protein